MTFANFRRVPRVKQIRNRERGRRRMYPMLSHRQRAREWLASQRSGEQVGPVKRKRAFTTSPPPLFDHYARYVGYICGAARRAPPHHTITATTTTEHG